jgi:hypothetical protein
MEFETEGFVRRLKDNEDLKKTLQLPVKRPDGILVGTLRLIDKVRSSSPDLAANLTKWRNASMRFFLSQFLATEERTQQWLSNVVIPAEGRLLFELLDDTGRAVGHAGVCNLSTHECELDNFIRGERGGDPNLFLAAERSMLRWLFCDIGVDIVTLGIFSNNWIPISNHISIGFTITEKRTMSRVEKDGMVQHLLDSKLGQPTKYSYLKMSLSRNDFFRELRNQNNHE